jgi:hypothetical protein
MKTQIIPIQRDIDDYGVYRGARLVFRGTLDQCLLFRRGY